MCATQPTHYSNEIIQVDKQQNPKILKKAKVIQVPTMVRHAAGRSGLQWPQLLDLEVSFIKWEEPWELGKQVETQIR